MDRGFWILMGGITAFAVGFTAIVEHVVPHCTRFEDRPATCGGGIFGAPVYACHVTLCVGYSK